MVTTQSYQMTILQKKKKIRAVSRNIVDIDMYCDHTILPNENFSEKKIIRAVSCRIIPIDMYGDQTILPNANLIEKKN